MKSEHRRELQTGELEKLAARIRPFLEAYGNTILWVGCGVILIAAVAIYWVRSSQATASTGWTRMHQASSAEDYANIADDYPSRPVGAWARLRAAESHLQSGIRLAFNDRSAGDRELELARKDFQKLLQDRDELPAEVKERALYGLARCLEATNDGNTGPVIEAYERLLAAFPDTVYREVAEKRRAALETGRAQSFYAWFAQQNPEPKDRPKPGDGKTSSKSAPEISVPTGHGKSSGKAGLPDIPKNLQFPDTEKTPTQKSPQPGDNSADQTSSPSSEPEAP